MSLLTLRDVDFVAVLAAVIVNMAIGFFWYSPALFANQWLQLLKITPGEVQKTDMTRSLVLEIIGTLLFVTIVALLLEAVRPNTLQDGIVVASLLFAAFPLHMLLSGMAWEQRPWKLQAIGGGATLVSTIVTVLILQYWPW